MKNQRKVNGFTFIEVMMAMVILVIVGAFGFRMIQNLSRQEVADHGTKTANQIADSIISNFDYLARKREWFDRPQISNGQDVAGIYYPYYKPEDVLSLMPAVFNDIGEPISLFKTQTPEWQQGHFKPEITVGEINTDGGTRKGDLTIRWNEGGHEKTLTRSFTILPSANSNPGYTLFQRVMNPLNGCVGIRGIVFEAEGLNGTIVRAISDQGGWIRVWGLSNQINGKLIGTFREEPHFYDMRTLNKYASSLYKEITYTFPTGVTIANNVMDESNTQFPNPGVCGQQGLEMYPFGRIAGSVKDADNTSFGVPNYLLSIRPIRQHVEVNMLNPIEELKTITDASGNYNLQVIPGEFIIVPVGTSANNPNFGTPNSEDPAPFIQIPDRKDRDITDDNVGSHSIYSFLEDGIRWPMDPRANSSANPPIPAVAYGGLAYLKKNGAGATWANIQGDQTIFDALKRTPCTKCFTVNEGTTYDSNLAGVSPNDLKASHFEIKKMPDLNINLKRADWDIVNDQFNYNTYAIADNNVVISAYNNPFDFYTQSGSGIEGPHGWNGLRNASPESDFGGVYMTGPYIKRNLLNEKFLDFYGTRVGAPLDGIPTPSGKAIFRNIAHPIQARSEWDAGSVINPLTIRDGIHLFPHSYGEGLAPVIVAGPLDKRVFVVYTGNRGAGVSLPQYYKVIPDDMGFTGVNSNIAVACVDNNCVNVTGNPRGYTPLHNTGYRNDADGLPSGSVANPILKRGGLKPFLMDLTNLNLNNNEIAVLPSNQLSNIRGQILAQGGGPWGGTDNDINTPHPPVTLTTYGILRDSPNNPNDPGFFTFKYATQSLPNAAFPTAAHTFNFLGPGGANDYRVLPSIISAFQYHNFAGGNLRWVVFEFANDVPDKTRKILGQARVWYKEQLGNTFNMIAFSGIRVDYRVYRSAGNIILSNSINNSDNFTDNLVDFGNQISGFMSATPPLSAEDDTFNIPTYDDYIGDMDPTNPNLVGGTGNKAILLKPKEEFVIDIMVRPNAVERLDPVYVRLGYPNAWVDSYAPNSWDQGRIALECRDIGTTTPRPPNMHKPWCAPYATFPNRPVDFYGIDEILEGYRKNIVKIPTVTVKKRPEAGGTPIDGATVKYYVSSWASLKTNGNRWEYNGQRPTALPNGIATNASSYVYHNMVGDNVRVEVSKSGYITTNAYSEVAGSSFNWNPIIELEEQPAGSGGGPGNDDF